MGVAAHLGRSDFFSFLDLPRKLNIDMARLDERYRTLSRQFHPDFFYNATPAERRQSLERSSFLNDAYRALRDPIMRIEYLLKIELEDVDVGPGAPGVKNDAARQVPPPALLEEVFALNEELDEVRASAHASRSRSSAGTTRPNCSRWRPSGTRSSIATRQTAGQGPPERAMPSAAASSKRCAIDFSNATTSITCSPASSGS